MTIGFRIRDPASGVVRLDLQDYTVKIIYTTSVYITGSGSASVAGIAEGTHGAYLMPIAAVDWKGDWQASFNSMPQMLTTKVTNGLVSWTAPPGYRPYTWQLIVVKYT